MRNTKHEPKGTIGKNPVDKNPKTSEESMEPNNTKGDEGEGKQRSLEEEGIPGEGMRSRICIRTKEIFSVK